MPDDSRTFANRLKQLREAAGLSQYALAKRSRVSMQALSRLELGEREPRWETVQRLAAALGVSCESFTDPRFAAETLVEEPRRRGRPAKQAPEAKPPARKRTRK